MATEEQCRRVRILAGYGMKHEHIAQVVGIGSATTLRKHFRDELVRGPAEAMAKVRKTLFQMATSGRHPAATMYWLKRRAGWSEKGKEPELVEERPKPPCIVVRFVTARRSEDGELLAPQPEEEAGEYELVDWLEFQRRPAIADELDEPYESPMTRAREPSWRTP